jgi:hypothetical protein
MKLRAVIVFAMTRRSQRDRALDKAPLHRATRDFPGTISPVRLNVMYSGMYLRAAGADDSPSTRRIERGYASLRSQLDAYRNRCWDAGRNARVRARPTRSILPERVCQGWTRKEKRTSSAIALVRSRNPGAARPLSQ